MLARSLLSLRLLRQVKPLVQPAANAAATFLTPVYEQFPVWYQYSVAVNTALGFVIVFGLWKMRRWAVMLYALGTMVGQAVTIVLGEWMVSALIYPLIALAIMAGYYREMD